MRNFVSAFLPLLPLAMCPGCGSGGRAAENPAQNAATAPTPAPAPLDASGNRAPTIDVGTGPVAQVGGAYELQPQWADAEGDALTFTAVNLPPWAQLDARTGAISGTPRTSDIGTYESISIVVADATHRVSSRDFTITVVGASSGVAHLEWPAPVSKVDGSLLDDLAGYRILYGRDPEDLDHSVFIADPTARAFEFATLDSGTWYFSIVAVNAEGLEGPATMPTMKII